MVTRLSFFSAKPECIAALHNFLSTLVPIISRLPGCVSCEIGQSESKPTRFLVAEKWESIAAHRQAVKAIPADQFNTAMALLDGPPSGEYFNHG